MQGGPECTAKKGTGKGETKNRKIRSLSLTGLPASQNNVGALVQAGKGRWKIENERFNAQKKKDIFCNICLAGMTKH